jgi:hypothetical protein
MKRCPLCNRTYADANLNFCLQDGAGLVAGGEISSSYDPEATLVNPGNIATSSSPTPETNSSAQPSFAYVQQSAGEKPQGEGRGRNTAMIVVFSVLGTIVLLAMGGAGAWIVLRNKSVGTSGNSKVVNTSNRNSGSRGEANRNSVSNPQASPGPSGTDSPALLTATEEQTVREEVTTMLNAWAGDAATRDAGAHASYYADNVDPYYKRGSADPEYIREESERAYKIYSTVFIQLSDIQVTPLAPDRATVIFDKTWDFSGDRDSSGSVQQQVSVEKVGIKWLITGEKDVKVYYLEK